jgi:hypothetical protein
VVVWHNGSDTVPDMETMAQADYIYCKSNWGVWTRFDFCHAFRTKYICVFDDDCIPGRKWLENCLETQSHEAPTVLGAFGVVFVGGQRKNRKYYGPGHDSDVATEVDIVGHSWFFPSAWLPDFYGFSRPGHKTCGEDYCWSLVAQQHGKPVLVPRHPRSDPQLWGSLRHELGDDKVALFKQPGEERRKAEAHAYARELGWKPWALRKPKEQK